MIRILVAENHPMVRRSLSLMLSNAKGINLVGSAIDGDDLMEVCSATMPDVLLLSDDIPTTDIHELVKKIRAQYPQVAMIILLNFQNIHEQATLLKDGANQCLIKNMTATDMLDAIYAVSTIQNDNSRWF